MIKKIVYTVIIIFGILFTVGYFRYNPTVNFTKEIPVYAEAIVRVNLREIEYTIIKDVVKHPFLYFKSTSSSSSSKTKLSLFDQIKMPVNLLFYTNYSRLKDIWISSVVEVKDKSKLASFFKQENYIKKRFEGIDCFFYKNNVYILDNNNLRILFGFGGITKIEEEIKFILQNKAYLKEGDKTFFNVKNSDKLVTVSTKKEGFFELGIDNENFLLSGELIKGNSLFLPYTALKKTNSLLSVSGRVKSHLLSGLLKEEQKNKFKKLTNLSLDSITSHWNGNFDVELKSFVHENDTIVTYEYDDDFNKVEKMTIQKNTIPAINVNIGGSSLFGYLYSKEAVKRVDGDTLLVVNPFFKTYAGKRKSNFSLSSKGIDASDFQREGANKFLLFFDVDKYMKAKKGTYGISNKQLSLVKKINAFVTKENKVEVRVCLKTSPQNFMIQLLK
ncbi:hypothetical protein CXF68_05730 [Tenacibaculum sp. Bg11-29]|uniref:hypothetical protein n=1 Tax=Tenacibaculum sp. Bg11-29 TaxID=2058306 RepID=UPI000C331DC6|nr:hypothetical protein [Tenacibaculum sp. Bg11-29]PKH50228.1 hypothetical protein CXF68_05730 [Tenacibaculum sp. Bg11-29]